MLGRRVPEGEGRVMPKAACQPLSRFSTGANRDDPRNEWHAGPRQSSGRHISGLGDTALGLFVFWSSLQYGRGRAIAASAADRNERERNDSSAFSWGGSVSDLSGRIRNDGAKRNSATHAAVQGSAHGLRTAGGRTEWLHLHRVAQSDGRFCAGISEQARLQVEAEAEQATQL